MNMSNRFLAKVQKHFNGGQIAFLINGAATVGHSKQKYEPQPKSHILYKN